MKIHISDIMRTMMRLGFDDGEIHDIFVAMGFPDDEVMALVDRLREEFEEMQIEPLPTHLAREVLKELERRLAELENKILPRLDAISMKIDVLRNKLDKLIQFRST